MMTQLANEKSSWIPIEECPKITGKRVLVRKDCGDNTLPSASIAYWMPQYGNESEGEWELDGSHKSAEKYGYRVTHFMPLPSLDL